MEPPQVDSTTSDKIETVIDKKLVTKPNIYPDLELCGAIDLLPKLTLLKMMDILWKSKDAMYYYWGCLLVKLRDDIEAWKSFVYELPENIRIVDNLDSTTFLVAITDLAGIHNYPNNGDIIQDPELTEYDPTTLPIVIARGESITLGSAAELLPDFFGLPWCHFVAQQPAQTHIIKAVVALKKHASILDVFLCPSVETPRKCLVFALLDSTFENNESVKNDDSSNIPNNKKRKSSSDDDDDKCGNVDV